jgi:tubulin-specific chaperone D
MDPYLERMVLPTINTFRAFASDLSRVTHLPSFSTRVSRLSLLIYGYLKTRGYKTIGSRLCFISYPIQHLQLRCAVRFFPHQVEDLSIALTCVNMSGSQMQHPALWHLRYVMLLWLSLICMIPFDLDRFDEYWKAALVESRTRG